MSNTHYHNIYIADTAGTVISATPICIQKIVLVPALATDAAELKYWEPGTQYAVNSGTYYSSTIKATISGNATFTMASGTILPNTVLDGDVFEIIKSETEVNEAHGPEVVTTAGNNTVVICANAAWTNEDTKWYHFKSYPTRSFVKMYCSALDVDERDFGGFWMPNLTLETLSSNAKVYIYV